MSYLDGVVKMWDMSKPIKERHTGLTGPYMFERQPTRKGPCKGFGAYLARNGREIREGSMVRLRVILHADLPGRLHEWYCDTDGNESMSPIVARLPSGRGFLAGWTMGEGMCCSFDGHIHDSLEDAALAAGEETRIGAEKEREYQEQWLADQQAEEALEDLRDGGP